MLITFKLLKNTFKFMMCFIVILFFYYHQSYSVKRPQWRIIYNYATQYKQRHITTQADLKYILIWNQLESTFSFLKKGQKAFTDNKCSYNNCYVTTHRNMIRNDYTNFNAILFSGKKIAKVFVNGYMKLPKRRQMSQMYIFVMQHDAVTYPVCHEKFDDFFNLTWTYKLDSDIVSTPFKILELDTDKVVAPNINVQWSMKYNYSTLLDAEEKLLEKQHFAIWNSTDCKAHTQSQEIGRTIKILNQDDDNIVDVVGPCGSKECIYKNHEDCLKVLDTYSFYLALETVEAEDYVTSGVAEALAHYCVPVVFGGANYSRFLPPNSYIDVKKLGIKETAKLMDNLSIDVQGYLKYFEWRTIYKIVEEHGSAACALCEALNQKEQRVQTKFREWWNPDYKDACKTNNLN